MHMINSNCIVKNVTHPFQLSNFILQTHSLSFHKYFIHKYKYIHKYKSLLSFITLIGVTLVNNKIIHVSGIRFVITRAVYCTVCPPPTSISPLSPYVWPLCPLLSYPFPSGNHHTIVCLCL